MAQDKDIEDSLPPAYKATLPVAHILRYEISSPTDHTSGSALHFPSSAQPFCNDQAQSGPLASTAAYSNAPGGFASSGQSETHEHAIAVPCSVCLQPQATSPIRLTCRHTICASHSKEFTLSFCQWCRDFPELARGSIADLLRAGPGVSFPEYQLGNYFAFTQAHHEDTESEDEKNAACSSGSSPFLKSPTGSVVEAMSGDSGTLSPLADNTLDNGIQSTTAVQTNSPSAPQPSATHSLPTSSAACRRSPSSTSLDSSSSGSSYRSYLACTRSEMEEAIRLVEEQEAIYFGGVTINDDSDHDVHMRGPLDED
ncbi:hypothetical protein FRC05_003508 [Tulasnella sp. 425]|nr:hypothetical protein FRC05_003508 [Tulasnella sp. 425]